ncbi:hypothetical protein LNP18_06190 [Leuconostoc citreum]|uniref:hypothetical protein n=1 Tax=Leuconostoc citreum TaxID=33964 RepID=UPI00200AA885|nr:hypothetical protein [Leuconostoc citreum]MCK8605692.1 hypothetical protein [Leuconostoc citreum]
MNRLINIISLIAGTIITMDVVLMVINGTMLYVMLTLIGFYVILCLSFKASAYHCLKRWINTGHFKPQRREEIHTSMVK